jgi:small GTP-binding protein
LRLKLGIVGEPGVGKSCCLIRYVDNEFYADEDMYTLGVDYKVKMVIIKDKKIKLHIYDTGTVYHLLIEIKSGSRTF